MAAGQTAAVIHIIQLMEQAKLSIDVLRLARVEEMEVDGRSLSIAITNLETSMLWVANALK